MFKVSMSGPIENLLVFFAKVISANMLDPLSKVIQNDLSFIIIGSITFPVLSISMSTNFKVYSCGTELHMANF